MDRRDITDGQVSSLVSDCLGTTPVQTVRMTDGGMSLVYDVTLPERHVMVRLHEDGGFFAGTQHNLSALLRLGLPVPHVLAVDLTKRCFPLAFMILSKIPGRDLRHELAGMSGPQMTRLAGQVASFQRAVMTLPPGGGYGYVSIGERGPHSSWWDVVLEQSWWDVTRAETDDQAPSGRDAVLGEWQARVRRLVFQHEPSLRRVPPTCFLDDITVKNVIVQDGELQGLVDFDCVCYGDPLYWLGLTATGVVSDVGLREMFYVRELCRCLGLTDRQRRACLLYAASIALGFVTRYAAGETQEWSRRMLRAVRSWVTALERSGPTPAW